MIKKPKITIIAPMGLPLPPLRQGGIEWITYHQAEGLIQKGYQVDIFAPRESKTKARLVPIFQKAISKYNFSTEVEASRKLRVEMSYLAKIINELIKRKDKTDIIISNLINGGILAPLAKVIKKPIIQVLHLPLYKELIAIYKEYKTPLISISLSQRRVASTLNYVGNVYNGLDLKKFSFNPSPQDYLLFAGKMRPSKNPLTAIKVARKTKTKLIMAGKGGDSDYFQKHIKSKIDNRKIIYSGEVKFSQLIKLYQNAKAFLFPIQWEEPFGLVMIEAMACGTPVIAFRRGSVPEVVKNGKTGYIVRNEKEMITAIKKVNHINRLDCHKHVEKNFSVAKMINDLEKVILKVYKKYGKI